MWMMVGLVSIPTILEMRVSVVGFVMEHNRRAIVIGRCVTMRIQYVNALGNSCNIADAHKMSGILVSLHNDGRFSSLDSFQIRCSAQDYKCTRCAYSLLCHAVTVLYSEMVLVTL